MIDLVMSIPRFVWLALALAGACVLAVRLHRIAKERRAPPSVKAEREVVLARLETMGASPRNAGEVPFEDTYPVLPPAEAVPATTGAVPSDGATAESHSPDSAHIEVQQILGQPMPVTPVALPRRSTSIASEDKGCQQGPPPQAGHTQKLSRHWTPEERVRVQQALDRARGVAAGAAEGSREVEGQAPTPAAKNSASPALREALLEIPTINGRPKKLWSPEEREQIQRALDRVQANRMRLGELSPLSRPTVAIESDKFNEAVSMVGGVSSTGRGTTQPVQVTLESVPKDLTYVSISAAEGGTQETPSRRRQWTNKERQRIQSALDKVWAQKGKGEPAGDRALVTSAKQTPTFQLPSGTAVNAHQQEVPSVTSLPAGPEVVELFDPMEEVFQEFLTERESSLPVAEGNAPSSPSGRASEFMIPPPRTTPESLLPVAGETKNSALPLETDAVVAPHASQQDDGVATPTVEPKGSTPKDAEALPRLPRLSLDRAAIARIQAESEKTAALLSAVFSEEVAPEPASPAALPTVVAALPATAKLALDIGRIASIQAEARKSDALLGGLFAKDEDASPETKPESRSGGSSQASAPELQVNAAHRELVRRLLTQATWHRAELQLIADELDLMLDGALEQVSDAFYDAFDEPLFDGDDPMEVSATAQALLQSTGQRVVTQSLRS